MCLDIRNIRDYSMVGFSDHAQKLSLDSYSNSCIIVNFYMPNRLVLLL